MYGKAEHIGPDSSTLLDVFIRTSRQQRQAIREKFAPNIAPLVSAVIIECSIGASKRSGAGEKSMTRLRDIRSRESALQIARVTTQFSSECQTSTLVQTHFCLSKVPREVDLPNDETFFAHGYLELCRWTPSAVSVNQFKRMASSLDAEHHSGLLQKIDVASSESPVDEFHFLLRLCMALENHTKRRLSRIRMTILSRLDVGVTLTVLWNPVREELMVLEGSYIVARGAFSRQR